MPEEQPAKAARPSQIRPQTLALWFLFVALLVAFATNISQDRKIAALSQDVASLRQSSQKQLADLREAQSALLEQDLLRLDQVNNQLQKANEEEQRQAELLAGKTRAELARTVEVRHQEMIRAISDLRADLRSEAKTRTSQPRFQAPSVEDAPLPLAIEAPPNPAMTLIASEKPGDELPAPPAAQKKSFWSKLNPFAKHAAHATNTAN